MGLLRPKRVLLLGAGFLLGSRAGRVPWEKTMAFVRQLQGKAQSKLGGTDGVSSDGASTDVRDTPGVTPM